MELACPEKRFTGEMLLNIQLSKEMSEKRNEREIRAVGCE